LASLATLLLSDATSLAQVIAALLGHSAPEWSLIMVARVNHEMFAGASHMPGSDPSDSEGVRVALETARSLEAQGEHREAARWIHRAADEAAKEDKQDRVLVLRRAAADLTDAIAFAKDIASAPSSVPTLNVRGRGVRMTRAQTAGQARMESPPPPSASAPGSMPPLLAALVSSMPPFSTRASSSPPSGPVSRPPTNPRPASSQPTIPPRPSSPAPRAERSSLAPAATPQAALARPVTEGPANDTVSAVSDKPAVERTMRIGAIRVAITGCFQDSKSFSVARLDKGEPAPAGTMEAMLVLTGTIDGSLQLETNVRVVERPAEKP
jgi:hypothetical protein